MKSRRCGNPFSAGTKRRQASYKKWLYFSLRFVIASKEWPAVLGAAGIFPGWWNLDQTHLILTCCTITIRLPVRYQYCRGTIGRDQPLCATWLLDTKDRGSDATVSDRHGVVRCGGG
jgi:hypothetical protein